MARRPKTLDKKGAAIDPNGIYVSTTAFATNADGIDVSVARRDRLRGEHPAVQAAGWNFVPDGTPENEWGSDWDRVVAENAARAAEAPQVDVVLDHVPEGLEVVTSWAEIRVGKPDGEGGYTVAGVVPAGSVFPADHPLVQQLGSSFFTITEKPGDGAAGLLGSKRSAA